MPRNNGDTISPESGKTRAPMSDAHKKALAEGRQHGRIVQDYLNAIAAHKPKRGRKVSPEALQERLAEVEKNIATASPMERLLLTQRRIDLKEQIERTTDDSSIDELEKQFVQVAKPYAERRGVSYDAFREIGVPTKVLKEAGLAQG